MTTLQPEASLQQSLDEVTRLLDRHRVLEALTHRQEGPKRDLLESLQHRQNLVELHKRLRAMHPADVAFVLDVQQALGGLRSRGELPPQTDRLFVVDIRNVLRGSVTLPSLLLTDPSAPIVASMEADVVTFRPLDQRFFDRRV